VNVFWNREERRLRALWRLLGQGALAVAAAAVPILAVAEPLAWLHRRGIFLPTLSREACDAAINMIVGPLITVAVIASVTLGLRWLERRSWDAYGVRLDGRGWGWLAGGFLLGAALLTGIFAVELALGWISVAGFLVANAGSAVGLGLAHALVKDLCVGIYEEVISRGVLLRNLSDGLGTPAGVLVSSSIFALLHLANPNASAFGMLGVFAAGLLLATARLRTGRLSAAIGLHVAWNLFEGAIYGFPVSGDLERASLIALRQGGPTLWTGGDFGPEAGLLGILACAAGMAMLLLLPRYPGPTGGHDAEADLPRTRVLGDDRGSAPDPDRPLPDREPEGGRGTAALR